MKASIAPRILNLSTRWRWVVSLVLRPLYPRERAPNVHWIERWMVHGLVIGNGGGGGWEKSVGPCRKSNRVCMVVRPVS
jgi:hypothetical protein